jgi:hypothetical protein
MHLGHGRSSRRRTPEDGFLSLRSRDGGTSHSDDDSVVATKHDVQKDNFGQNGSFDVEKFHENLSVRFAEKLWKSVSAILDRVLYPEVEEVWPQDNYSQHIQSRD